MSLQNELAPYITNRELEVMLLAFTGRVSKDIAFDLKITKSAVDLYRRNVLARFSVHSLAELLFEYPDIPDLKPGEKRYYPNRRRRKK